MSLMLTSLSRRTSASDISVVDLNRARLTIVARLGTSDTATSADGLAKPSDYDVVIDCTGAPSLIQDAIERLAPGGTFLQFGVCGPDATVAVRPEQILMDEITITGACAAKRSFEPCFPTQRDRSGRLRHPRVPAAEVR